MNRHVLALAEELGRRPRDLREVTRLAAKASVRRFLTDHSVESGNGDCALAVTCVRRGDCHALAVLLEQGANANIVVRETYTKSHRSLLHEAIRCENPRIVQLLLKHGADVRLKDSDGLTPDLEAIRVANAAVLRMVLDSHTRLDLSRLLVLTTWILFVDRKRVVSPDRSLSLLGLLLDRGADPEAEATIDFEEREASRAGAAVARQIGREESALQVARSGFTGLDGQQQALRLLEQYSVRPSAPSQAGDDRASSDREPACPVCLEMPVRVLCCPQCDNMICSDCVGRIDTCPLCRLDFGLKPPARNRLAERILEWIRQSDKRQDL